MTDFTPSSYKRLLTSLQRAGYSFLTFEDYCQHYAKDKNKHANDTNKYAKGKIVILRHDVDKKPEHALRLAKIEATLGIRATYYFRIVPESNQPRIIMQIAALEHEIAYHYEDLSLSKGDVEQAYISYQKNLDYFRQFYPVKTISMHGSPAGKFDNRDIWKHHNYRDLGIIGEPYFDFIHENINQIDGFEFYFTDTGGMWDGDKFNVRDKAIGTNNIKKISVHTTSELINYLTQREDDTIVMINTHPQRWIANRFEWLIERLMQRVKNSVKYLIVKLQ